MAHVNDCVPGTKVKLLHAGVLRVVGKTGTIVELTRVRRPPATEVTDTVTVDVPGHGDVVVRPADLEVVSG